MVATWKAESENEEIQDKVRAMPVVATDSVEGATELEQQIAKLMAALTKVGQGSSAASALSSPGREAVIGDAWTGVLLATPALKMARLDLDRPLQTAAHQMAIG